MNQITVKEMLAEMDTGAAFSISYIKYDRQRRKGGDRVDVLEAQLLMPDKEDTLGRGRTPLEETRERTARVKAGRDPRHMKWYTRNIRILQDGAPTSLVHKIHPPLVLLFNDQIVVA